MTAFRQFMDKAAAEGLGGTLPEGEHVASLVAAKYGKTQGGKQQIGLQWKLSTGESGWSNLNFTEDNGKALAIFFRQLNSLGIDQGFLDSLPTTSLEPVAARIQAINAGRQFKIRNKTWGTNNDQNGIDVLGALGDSPVGQYPPQAQPQPQYQQAPQQFQGGQTAPQQYQPAPVQYAPVDPATGYPARPGI